MLSRLDELREAAGVDVEIEKPSNEPPVQAPLDIEWLEFIEEMREFFKEILEDEGACVQACKEVADRVESMEEIVQLERDALLPTKLAQLANRFESQELVCQRMIRRAKGMLTTLKAEDQDHDEDDLALTALEPVRKSIARVRAIEFKNLVQGFFAARSHNRQETISRAARQLRFAYPDALEEELNDILEFPELAWVAISRRLEKGPEVTLDGILGEMEGKKADARKLEQGAKELKLMFLQFEQLIDTQGENLNAIEANIKTVMEETSEAIGILQDAEEQKRAYERKKLKFYLVVAFLVFYFIIWPMFESDDDKRYRYEDRERGGWGISSFFTVIGRACGLVSKEEPRYHHGRYSLSQVIADTRMSPRKFYRQQSQGHVHPHHLAPESSKLPETRNAGFFAPRPSSFTDSLIRSVSIMAKGGAASHSALRKSKRESQNQTHS